MRSIAKNQLFNIKMQKESSSPTKKAKVEEVEEESKVVSWSNDRNDANWFNFPLDCWIFSEQQQEEEKDYNNNNMKKLVMFCKEGSDLWRKTQYGFIRDSAHAYLGVELKIGRAIEVTFAVDSFKGQFDQGGLLMRQDEKTWVKCGVELSDNVFQLSTVVTRLESSDWSTAAWPEEWEKKQAKVVVRVSRGHDFLTIRVRLESHDKNKWRLMRLCPMEENAVLKAGPYACAPSRDGLFVEFFNYVETVGDKSLH